MSFDIQSICSAWKGHEEFAQWLVKTMRPKVICELGADYGFSAIALAQPGIGQVYSIDAFEGDDHTGQRNAEEECRKNVIRSGCANLTILKKRFDEAARGWTREIDILHIDGRHGYGDVKHDFESWSRFVRPGGVILLHDTRSFPDEVGRFFEEITLPKFNFAHSHGLGVVTQR